MFDKIELSTNLAYKIFNKINKKRLPLFISSIYLNYESLFNSIDNKNYNIANINFDITNIINSFKILNYKVVNVSKDRITIIIINNDLDYINLYIDHINNYVSICLFLDFNDNYNDILNNYNCYLEEIIKLCKKFKNELNINKIYLVNDSYIYRDNYNYNFTIIQILCNSLSNDIFNYIKLESIYDYDNTFKTKFQKYLLDYNNYKEILLLDFANKLFKHDLYIFFEFTKFIHEFIIWNHPNYYNNRIINL